MSAAIDLNAVDQAVAPKPRAGVSRGLGFALLVLLLANLGATGAVLYEQVRTAHWDYRVEFIRDNDASGPAVFASFDQQNWEIVTLRRVHQGEDLATGQWGTEVLLRRRANR